MSGETLLPCTAIPNISLCLTGVKISFASASQGFCTYRFGSVELSCIGDKIKMLTALEELIRNKVVDQ